MISPELVRREFVRRHHEEFIKYLWQREDPFITGYHTKTICDRVDRAIRDFKDGKSTFLMIKCPFRHGKSDLLSRFLPARFIGLFPDLEVVIAGYSASLSDTFSKFARNLMKEERYAELFPDVKLSKDDQSVESWGIEGRLGKTWWVGLGGSITGKGGSCILVDDFFKGREEAESEIIRDKTWESFTNDILTRRAPVSIVCVLATPWHTDDLFGRITKMMAEDEKFPRFEELKFPAVDDKYKGINGTKYLFPERFDEEWYETQFAALGPYASASLLQCDPVIRHGNLFDTEGIKFYNDLPEGVPLKRGWDLASSEKQRVRSDPDSTASIRLGVAWKIQGEQPAPVLYIDDFTLDTLSAPARDKKIKSVAMNDGPIEIGIEAYGPYKDAFKNLEAALWGTRKVTKVQLPGDKVTRAEVLEAAFHCGNVYMRKAPWNNLLIKYLTEFPGGAHDDPVDALVTAFALHKPYVKHVWPQMASLGLEAFNIKWGVRTDKESLHYGAVVLDRDLTVWVVTTLWDDIGGKLFVYGCAYFEGPDATKVTQWMFNVMKMRNHTVDKIVSNDRMNSEDSEKTITKTFNEEFKRLNVDTRIKPSIRYDQWGAITIVNKLLSENRIYVEESCDEALMQWTGWSVEKGKPVHKDTGYCECLCLIVSELKRKNAFRKRSVVRDYVDSLKHDAEYQ